MFEEISRCSVSRRTKTVCGAEEEDLNFVSTKNFDTPTNDVRMGHIRIFFYKHFAEFGLHNKYCNILGESEGMCEIKQEKVNLLKLSHQSELKSHPSGIRLSFLQALYIVLSERCRVQVLDVKERWMSPRRWLPGWINEVEKAAHATHYEIKLDYSKVYNTKMQRSQTLKSDCYLFDGMPCH